MSFSESVQRRLSITTLFLVYFLFFWSDWRTFRPGMDAMTYGALAKHILATGDWKTLHYTNQAYSNFYQHPPLAIWMMAITMKLFGSTADWTLKLLPALLAGATAVGVYVFSWRFRGERFAFMATLILLSSTRFAKYSKGFMLDPFLAVFAFWSIYLAWRARTNARPLGFAFLSGLLTAAAFLSKGLFAFAPLAVNCAVLILDRRTTRKNWVPLVVFLIGLTLPFVLWFGYGDASIYISRYYFEHVADRIGPKPLLDHFAPLINLAKIYWPWLPFFARGLWKVLKTLKKKSEPELVVMAAASLAFLGGFSLVGSFLEQYHVATYPFAAIVAAHGVPEGWQRHRPKIVNFLFGVVLFFVVLSFVKPYAMRGTEYKNPIRIALKSAKDRCPDPGIRRIAVSTGVAEIWYALAMGSWNTDWDVASVMAAEAPDAHGSDLLLAEASEPIANGWIPTGIQSENLRIYAARPTFCR